jgi:hypothetical protein
MRSTADDKKQELLSGFIEGRRNLLALSAQIPFEAQDQVFLGIWSMRDLLAHLIGWDHSNLEAIQMVSEHRLPAFYEHIDKDWRSYNARLVSLYKKGTLPDLIKAAQVSQGALLDRITPIPAKDLFHDYGVRFRRYKITIARLIKADTKDVKAHLEQIKEFFAKISTNEQIKGFHHD